TRLVEDEQNAPTVIENKMVAAELHTNRKSDGADIRDVTLVIRSVDQSESGLAHRTGFSAPTSTSETLTGSAATPFTATREASAPPVYASSDNPLFQIQRDRALQAQIIAALKSGQDEVRLSLYPPQLGQVTINLALDGQKVKVGLKTASREASDLLTTEQPSLSHALQREGFTLEGFDVTEDDTHKHRSNGDDQTKTSTIPAISGSSEFSIDITI
ncbi:MAG: flagellar hook-length control protein FliK, partial [Hyphomicrobiales bacterium]|nr:flagellar hook-length control protein FliK [Hyphomicrobiales bacterium]